MSILVDNFSSKIEEIFFQKELPKKIAVAVSGGADSLALTLLLRDFCAAKKIELFAVTVDHKMREASSHEALTLNKILLKEKIFHEILSLENKKIPSSNIEARLREMRYTLLYAFCIKHKIEFLFLGHQLEDVAENFLIRLFRGSGLDGLSTMTELSELIVSRETKSENNEARVFLVRPLLDFLKDDLKNFLDAKKIKWFEDETNEDEKFLRNKIRKFFNSFEEKNLIKKRVKNASDEIRETRDMFDDLMLCEAAKILKFDGKGWLLLNHKEFKKINPKIALKILALTLMEVSGKNYKPRLKGLKIFYDFLIQNSKIKSRNFYGCTIEWHSPECLLIKPQKPIDKISFRTVLAKIFNK